MKALIAAAALAATTAIAAVPTTASAQGIYVGPRGGVGVGVGPAYGGYGYGGGYGYRRGFGGPGLYEGRSAYRPGLRGGRGRF